MAFRALNLDIGVGSNLTVAIFATAGGLAAVAVMLIKSRITSTRQRRLTQTGAHISEFTRTGPSTMDDQSVVHLGFRLNSTSSRAVPGAVRLVVFEDELHNLYVHSDLPPQAACFHRTENLEIPLNELKPSTSILIYVCQAKTAKLLRLTASDAGSLQRINRSQLEAWELVRTNIPLRVAEAARG